MILSKLKPLLTRQNEALLKRVMSDHRTFPIVPSRWQWIRFKDLFHFYFFLGAIPLTLITGYANIFIGPATLTEIPEGYVPKNHEYIRSPITRFIAKYILNTPQQEYEKFLAYIYLQNEKRQLNEIQSIFKEKIAERNDYQAYYYRPVLAKYHRQSKEAYEYMETIRGD